MRRLPQNINDTPKIFGLKFKSFFLFGFLSALARYLIHDDLWAILSIAGGYLIFFIFENFIPKNFFFYLVTKADSFENPDQ